MLYTNEQKNEQFWMVWNPHGNAPTVRHPEEFRAQQEATRLATLNRGQSFYVLMATERYCVNEVQVTRLSEPEIPF